MEKLYKELLEEAKKASENSYSPYSNFPVGACVLYENNKKYTGVNVENASYGLTLCAERNAISSAISQGEKSKIKAIAIYSPKQRPCMPCGACRQWLSEFSINEKETKVILEDDNGSFCALSLGDVFPYGFNLDNLFVRKNLF